MMESADEADIFDGRSSVAQRVNLLSAGAISAVCPINPMPHFAQHAAKFLERQIHLEAGNCFQFIERASGVAEPRR